jgi:hypothetical protein
MISGGRGYPAAVGSPIAGPSGTVGTAMSGGGPASLATTVLLFEFLDPVALIGFYLAR